MNFNLPTTLEEALHLIQSLLIENQQLKRQILQLQEENQSLKREIQKLKLQIGKNSTNSSKPPSTDQKGNTPGSEKHGGAEKGHLGMFRALLPEEQVTNRQSLFPERCPRCGSKDLVSERKPIIHQVIDLPEIRPEVMEYRLELCRCMKCGKHVRGELPKEASRSMIGPRLTAWIGLASCQFSLSLRKIRALIQDLIQQSFSPGTIFACQQRVSEAIEESYAGIKEEIKREKVVGADETSWRTDGKKRWTWIVTGQATTLLKIASSRSRKCAEEILGKNTKQPLITDRYQAYETEGPHQYCLAHWKRNIEELKNYEQGLKLYQFLSLKINRVFTVWHKYQAGNISPRGFKIATIRLKNQIDKELKYYARAGPTRELRTFCKNSLRHYFRFWTYTVIKGMEPTNNRAERELRGIVIRRKICMGTKSRRGEQFLERVYSVYQTALKRGIEAWLYLKRAVTCYWSKQPSPPLRTCV